MTCKNILLVLVLATQFSISNRSEAQSDQLAEIDKLEDQIKVVEQWLDSKSAVIPKQIQDLPMYANAENLNVSDVTATYFSARKAIYCFKRINGCDDRYEVEFHPNQNLRTLSASVAMLVKSSKLAQVTGGYALSNYQYLSQKFTPMCSDEPYRDQPAPGYCTGFLIGPNKLATAGHCVKAVAEGGLFAVFEFRTELGILPKYHKQANVFKVAGIVGFKHNAATGEDWGVLELERVVENRPVLELRTSGKIPVSDEICVIGHPAGLPKKISCGAVVTDNSNKLFFKSNLDTYAGNSGSPVVGKDSLVVEGILVRGHKDFDNSEGCYRSVVCKANTDCSGEDVTRSQYLANYVPVNQPMKDPVSACQAGRLYISRGCEGGYFEDGIFYQPN